MASVNAAGVIAKLSSRKTNSAAAPTAPTENRAQFVVSGFTSSDVGAERVVNRTPARSCEGLARLDAKMKSAPPVSKM